MIFVRDLQVPHDPVNKLRAFVDVKRIQVTDVDIDPQLRLPNPTRVRDANRRRIVRFPIAFIERLAKDRLHQLIALRSSMRWLYLLPLQSRINSGFERGDSLKPVGVFEREPQAPKPTIEIPKSSVPLRSWVILYVCLRCSRTDQVDKRLPLLRPVFVIHVKGTSGARRNNHHFW